MKKSIVSYVCICCVIAVCLCGCGRKSYLSKSDSEPQTTSESSGFTEDIEPKDSPGYVQITGAVNNPGVYEIGDETRLFMVVKMAGGLREDACTERINQAQRVSDGESIYIISKAEAEALDVQEREAASPGSQDDGRININTADMTTLMTLTGIGESKAKQIVDYRDTNGPFKSPEDIMNIQGIKEGVFNKIKDDIKV